MARRRNEEEKFVDLRAPEHAWWAEGSTDPYAPSTVAGRPVTRDTVAAEVAQELGSEPEPPEDLRLDAEETDPYAVLRLPSTASWEEITASYRRLARWWHPDGLGATAEWDRAACEDKIRQLNAAYSDLQVRRGR